MNSGYNFSEPGDKMKSLLALVTILFSLNSYSCNLFEHWLEWCTFDSIKAQYCYDGVCVEGKDLFPRGLYVYPAKDVANQFIEKAVMRERVHDLMRGMLIMAGKGRFVEIHSSSLESLGVEKSAAKKADNSSYTNQLLQDYIKDLNSRGKSYHPSSDLVFLDRKKLKVYKEAKDFEEEFEKNCRFTGTSKKEYYCNLLVSFVEYEDYYRAMAETMGEKVAAYIKPIAKSQYASLKMQEYHNRWEQQECKSSLSKMLEGLAATENPFRYMTVHDLQFSYGRLVENKPDCE